MTMENRGHGGRDAGQRTACIVRSRSCILWGLALLALALAAAGCDTGLFQSSHWPTFERVDTSVGYQVVPRSGGQPMELAAEDIIQIMRHVGFSDDQIVQLGPRLRDALRTAGAALFARGKRAEVLLAVNEGYLFVQSAERGSFIYDIEDKVFAAVPPIPLK